MEKLSKAIVDYRKNNNIILGKLRDEKRLFNADIRTNYNEFYRKWKDVMKKLILAAQLFKLSAPSGTIDLTLPGHNYLGPGSEVSGPDSTNRRDQVAYKHDWEYFLALHKEDVSEADYRGVQEFGRLWEQNTDYLAKLSALSLKAKIIAEAIFGISIYPYNL